MAGHTALVQSIVDTTLMTAGACQRRVTTRQRELRVCRMVETRTLPGRCRMADRAILREPGGTMVRVMRAVVVTEMAGYTFLGFSLIDSVLVAVGTGK